MKQADTIAEQSANDKPVETSEAPEKGAARPGKALIVRTRLRAGGGSDDGWVFGP